MCQHPRNLLYHGPTMRALLVALDAWADRAVAPPPNNYPRLENGTLVSLEQAAAAFPVIPGVRFPTVLNELEVLDFGADFSSRGGRLTRLPPAAGPTYKIFVPKPDADGQDVAGIRPLEIRVPTGTHTGWNLRDAASRAPDLCGLSGSYFPLPATDVERRSRGDARQSLRERYTDHQGYVNAVKKAASALVAERFLLEEDAARYVHEAEASRVLRD
jgi:hypothetical protein